MSELIAAAELRQFIERIERLQTERQERATDIKDVLSEAKSRGYDVKAIRTILKIRSKDENKLAEEQAIVEVYANALGMQGDLFGVAA